MSHKETDLYEGMTLFDTAVPEHGNSNELNAPISNSTMDPIQIKCMDYLHDGVESVRLICEKLIEEGLKQDERFTTGKPKFYPDICFFINTLCLAGTVIKVEVTTEDYLFKAV